MTTQLRKINYLINAPLNIEPWGQPIPLIINTIDGSLAGYSAACYLHSIVRLRCGLVFIINADTQIDLFNFNLIESFYYYYWN